jgi:predicted transcriptional regulator
VALLGKNRDSLSIIAAILEAASSKDGAGKTHIMFRAYLSFELLEKYLRRVSSSGFVSVSGSRYFLTEAGRTYLLQYRNFCENYAKAKQSLEALNNERDGLSLLSTNRRAAVPETSVKIGQQQQEF